MAKIEAKLNSHLFGFRWNAAWTDSRADGCNPHAFVFN